MGPGRLYLARYQPLLLLLLLLAAVGRAAHSGGQTKLYLTPMHGKANLLTPLIANIRVVLQHVLDDPAALVSDKVTSTVGPFRPPVGL